MRRPRDLYALLTKDLVNGFPSSELFALQYDYILSTVNDALYYVDYG